MAVQQRGGDVQLLLDANDKMLHTWNTLLESRPTLDKKDEYKEWHVKCVRYKEQIARSLERLAALADDQIAKKDASGSTAAASSVPVATSSVPVASADASTAQQQQQQLHLQQQLLQKQHLLQLQKQHQQQQAAAAAQLQQKKQQQQQQHQQHHNMQQHPATSSTATPAGFPPGTDLAAMQLAMSQMMPMNMNQMMAGYPNMNGGDMSSLFLMANNGNGGNSGNPGAATDLNQMNLFNYNMQAAAAAAAYNTQLYNANFNPALVQNMMGGGGGGGVGYPNQVVLQAQMAATGAGFPYQMANATNNNSTSASSGDPSAMFFSDNDTVRNVMDDFMSSNE